MNARIFACDSHLNASIATDTIEAAQALAAQFPKGAKVSANPHGCSQADGTVTGLVNFRVTLQADGVNGGKNETGVKRYRAFRKGLAALNIPAEFVMAYTNSITEAALEARIG